VQRRRRVKGGEEQGGEQEGEEGTFQELSWQRSVSGLFSTVQFSHTHGFCASGSMRYSSSCIISKK
jgi:hypothetical protein